MTPVFKRETRYRLLKYVNKLWTHSICPWAEDKIHVGGRRRHNQENMAFALTMNQVERETTRIVPKRIVRRSAVSCSKVIISFQKNNWIFAKCIKLAFITMHFILLLKALKTSLYEQKFATCWKHGTFKLFPLSQVPISLRKLLTKTNTIWKQIRQKLQSYNSAQSMASITACWDNRTLDSFSSSPTTTVYENVYHYIAALIRP